MHRSTRIISENTSTPIRHRGNTTQIYTLDAVAAVDITSVALVTRLKGRSRDKECEGQKCEDTSEHAERVCVVNCWREQMREVDDGATEKGRSPRLFIPGGEDPV